jgi:hypothetical protein
LLTALVSHFGEMSGSLTETHCFQLSEVRALAHWSAAVLARSNLSAYWLARRWEVETVAVAKLLHLRVMSARVKIDHIAPR